MSWLLRAAAVAVNLLLDPADESLKATSTATAEAAGVGTGSTFYLTTITTKFTTTTEFATATRFTTTTKTATTTATTTQVAETTLFVAPTAANIVPGQAKQQWTLKNDSTDCNFELFHLADSLLPIPLNIISELRLGDWEAAALQYTELERLLEIHQGALIGRRGPREVNELKIFLRTFVKKPLTYACGTLERLLKGLVDIKHVSNGTRRERLHALADLLEEVHSDLLGYRERQTYPVSLLPPWGLVAPELRSSGCPNRDCLKINDVGLELTAFGIPHRLQRGVETLKKDTDMTVWQQLALLRLRSDLSGEWWTSHYRELWRREIITTALLLLFVLYLLNMINYRYFCYELFQFGITRRGGRDLR